METPKLQRKLLVDNRLLRLFTIEGLASVSGNLLMMGIFFYTHRLFGWQARSNLLLSATQGTVYIAGALSANPIAARFGRRNLLRVLHPMMALVALVAAMHPTPNTVVCVLMAYTILSAAQWPATESLVSTGADAETLSRRISVYNAVWSATGAATVAGCGALIEFHPAGIFVVPVAAHFLAFLILLTHPQVTAAVVHAAPEPALIPLRTEAMRLSRIALPATYAVTYALGAMMPTLPIILRLSSPAWRTLLASVWMIARFFVFVALGMTDWWHTRPRALLLAAVVLLGSFLGITLLDNLTSMIVFQTALGIAIGFIYASSLYFGMVLSDGSAEQGGYHEALIGLGSILGPGSGAAAQFLLPAFPSAGIVAVAGVLTLSVLGAAVTCLKSRAATPRADSL